jgi:hypothetical protein
MKTEKKTKTGGSREAGRVTVADLQRAVDETEARMRPRFQYKPEWCDHKGAGCEFHSYPADGQCVCGVFKHHVHCQHGGIIQVG